uniref:Uncharacterized protein n=1 Tax=Oryza barthii TaxID=65489 RepID=A0A0D3FAR9_9ORYZ
MRATCPYGASNGTDSPRAGARVPTGPPRHGATTSAAHYDVSTVTGPHHGRSNGAPRDGVNARPGVAASLPLWLTCREVGFPFFSHTDPSLNSSLSLSFSSSPLPYHLTRALFRAPVAVASASRWVELAVVSLSVPAPNPRSGSGASWNSHALMMFTEGLDRDALKWVREVRVRARRAPPEP